MISFEAKNTLFDLLTPTVYIPIHTYTLLQLITMSYTKLYDKIKYMKQTYKSYKQELTSDQLKYIWQIY